MKAIDSFRLALEAERQYPNVRTQAAIEFAWWIAVTALTTSYAEALDAISGIAGPSFPVERFKAHGARALILRSMGRMNEAASHARMALDAAGASHSGFRYHAWLGLVGDVYSDACESLRKIAAEQPDAADGA